MHYRLFANQQQLQPAALERYAHALGLDETVFQACLDGGTYIAKINTSVKEGQNAGVPVTLAFCLE